MWVVPTPKIGTFSTSFPLSAPVATALPSFLNHPLQPPASVPPTRTTSHNPLHLVPIVNRVRIIPEHPHFPIHPPATIRPPPSVSLKRTTLHDPLHLISIANEVQAALSAPIPLHPPSPLHPIAAGPPSFLNHPL